MQDVDTNYKKGKTFNLRANSVKATFIIQIIRKEGNLNLRANSVKVTFTNVFNLNKLSFTIYQRLHYFIKETKKIIAYKYYIPLITVCKYLIFLKPTETTLFC